MSDNCLSDDVSRRDDWERALLELVPDKGVRDALDAQYMALEAENLSLRERSAQYMALKAENMSLRERVGFMGLGTHAELVRVRYEMKGMREENALLRDQLDAKEHDAKRNLREYMRVCDENDGLRELCLNMFEEHQRIYDASPFIRKGASSKQMAHWYVECRKYEIEVSP